MIRYYCPGCWKEFFEDSAHCPNCGLDIHKFWNARDYSEKLITALHHPEPSTPIRAAWLLGEAKDPRAVRPLIELIRETTDVCAAREAVKALCKIDTMEAREFLSTLLTHRDKVVRELVQNKVDKK